MKFINISWQIYLISFDLLAMYVIIKIKQRKRYAGRGTWSQICYYKIKTINVINVTIQRHLNLHFEIHMCFPKFN